MIRAIRPAAMAQDDAAMIGGWNISPNIEYGLYLTPGPSACGVFLFDAGMATLIASGAALVGTAQPCVLVSQSGTVGMVDQELGWHLLLTTDGTETERTVRIGPAVDLPDEIHPAYADDDLAVARATAGIDGTTHYIDDLTVTFPLGLGAGLGDVASVPVDGASVIGQVESITWTGTPNGVSETAVIRRHVAIAPEPFVEIVPPELVSDTGTATHLAGTNGNVLTNDEAGLIVTAVNGLSSNVGIAVDGNNGGSFIINSDGSWTFSPAGDFALLDGSETADTSVTYHASDGAAEATATLTITVSRSNTPPVAIDDVGTTTADATTSGNVLTNDTDADLDSLTISRVAGSAASVSVAVAGSNGGLFTIASDGAWMFDPGGDFASLTGEQTATTSVTYHISDGEAEDEGTLTVTVSAPPPLIEFVGKSSIALRDANATVSLSLPAGIQPGDMVIIALMIGARSDVAMSMSTAGYTKVTELYANDTEDTNLAVFWKVMGDTPDTVAVANKPASTAGYSTVMTAHVWRGASSIDVYSQAYGINGSNGTFPTITPGPSGVIVAIGAAVTGYFSSYLTGFALPSAYPLSNHQYNYHLASNYNSAALSVSSLSGAFGEISLGSWSGLYSTANYTWAAIVLSLSA